MRKLRVGLIGLGGVAEPHLEGYRQVDQIEVTAAAELVEDRRHQMTSRWGLEGYRDYEEMLERENLDLVCVLTPARTHREITERVAAAGVHVLCEKPLALSAEDATAMISSCQAAGVKLCYGASYRFLPACRKAKEMIAQGMLGEITLLIETCIGGQGFEHYRDLGERHYPLGGPGGGGMGLVDHGIHLIDLFRWFTGSDVEYVSGRGNYSGQAPVTEYLTMLFGNGAVGQLIYNEATFSSGMPAEGMFSWGWSWDIGGNLRPGGSWDPDPGSIRVHGENGALRIYHYGNKLFLSNREECQEISLLHRPMPGNFAMQMESFAERIHRDEDAEVTGFDGLAALRVLLAAYESQETRSLVAI
jgi:predicted dehydrogenase